MKLALRVLLISLLIVFVLTLIFLVARSVYVIDPQEMALENSFGKTKNKTYHEGLHIVSPFSHLIRFPNVQQVDTINIELSDQDGLGFQLKVKYAYRLDPVLLPQLYRELGLKYHENLEDQLSASARVIFSRYSITDLKMHEEKLGQVIQTWKETLKLALSEQGILLQNLFVQEMQLPEKMEKVLLERKHILEKMENARGQLEKLKLQNDLLRQKSLSLEVKD